jgi:hypothetical protein
MQKNKGHVKRIVDSVLFGVIRLVLVFVAGAVVGWIFDPSVRLTMVVVGGELRAQPSSWELEARR